MTNKPKQDPEGTKEFEEPRSDPNEGVGWCLCGYYAIGEDDRPILWRSITPPSPPKGND